MQYFTARDLRSRPSQLWSGLARHEEVIITTNGRPAAIMVGVGDDDVEETLRAFRQARAMRNFTALRDQAAARGWLTDDEIAAEIKATRTDRAASSR